MTPKTRHSISRARCENCSHYSEGMCHLEDLDTCRYTPKDGSLKVPMYILGTVTLAYLALIAFTEFMM